MSNISSGQFEYELIGNGKTNIVFLNGFRIKYNSWDMIYPTLAKKHKVLLFNRLGVGSSCRARIKQTGNVVVEEMHAFLSNIGIRPPYLFVAHSLGGLYANLFARTYPDIVSGVVFVDASNPDEIAEQRRLETPFILRSINNGIKKLEKVFDKYRFSEDEAIEETVTQFKNTAPFPDIPVAVVSGTKKMPFVPQQAFEIHQRYQTELLGLSTLSKQYICNESGHFPQITEPEKLISAIVETANKIV